MNKYRKEWHSAKIRRVSNKRRRALTDPGPIAEWGLWEVLTHGVCESWQTGRECVASYTRSGQCGRYPCAARANIGPAFAPLPWCGCLCYTSPARGIEAQALHALHSARPSYHLTALILRRAAPSPTDLTAQALRWVTELAQTPPESRAGVLAVICRHGWAACAPDAFLTLARAVARAGQGGAS